jgi:DNA-3-methyladenine glycosylase
MYFVRNYPCGTDAACESIVVDPFARRVPSSFFTQGTLKVARALIGMRLVRQDRGTLRVGRIVETEAYLGPRDRAAHSSRGRTARNEVMFGPPGHAYVYFIYGIWNCMNVVTARTGIPQAVLVRALEPVQGITGRSCGPGLLCRALRIDRRLNGIDLSGDLLWLSPGVAPARRLRIGRSPRIGVDYAGEWARRPWRFFDRDSACISRPRL